MFKRRYFWLLLAIAGVVGVAGLVGFREPRYQGRTLDEYLVRFARAETFTHTVYESEQKALLSFGTSKVPYLLHCIAYKPPLWQIKLRQTFGRFFGEQADLFGHKQKRLRSYGTIRAFRILGPKADGAIPELHRLMIGTDRDSALRAAWALGCIGTNALPVLVSAVTNTPAPNRYCALSGILEMGDSALPAVPSLIPLLGHQDQHMASEVARILGNVKQEPALVIPPLAKSLQDARLNVRCQAALALGNLGEEARPAIPALLRALDADADRLLQWSVSNALRRIDRGALENVRGR